MSDADLSGTWRFLSFVRLGRGGLLITQLGAERERTRAHLYASVLFS